MTWQPGETLDARAYRITRSDLVRYAGASGDFNPIHWSDRIATSVGLPGVVAHGMYTLALAARALTEWVGDPARIVSFGARFSRPVEVPDDDAGTLLEVAGVVTDLGEDQASIDLTVTCQGAKVLGMARAVVRC